MSGCVSEVLSNIDVGLRDDTPNVRLPDETLLGTVTLKDGKIDQLEAVSWGSIDQALDLPQTLSISTQVFFPRITVRYNCEISSPVTRQSCEPVVFSISKMNLKVTIDVEKSTGALRLSDVEALDGNYKIEGSVNHQSLAQEGVMTPWLRQKVAAYFEDFVNITKPILVESTMAKCRN